jgi:hypothetical protein
MFIKRNGRKYELITVSQPDCRSLELSDVTRGEARIVLLGKLTEDGRYHFLSLIHRGEPAGEPMFLPLELVEEFISWMKERL